MDIGTTTAALRAIPLYPGRRSGPPSGKEWDSLVNEFMAVANQVFPSVCIHFENWKGRDAIHFLDRYHNLYPVHDDEIQGTASVVLAGLFNALQIKGERLVEQHCFFAGAGSAGIGSANLLMEAMLQEGIDRQETRAGAPLFDIKGLVRSERDDLNPSRQVSARKAKPAQHIIQAVTQQRPATLVDVSTVGVLFTERQAFGDRPLTNLSEAFHLADWLAQLNALYRKLSDSFRTLAW